MTTMFSKWGFQTSSRIVLFFGMLLLGSGAFAQLDSVSVNNVSFTQEFVTDSTTGVTDTMDLMNVELYLDDLDFLGEVLIMVYDQTNGSPLGIEKQTKNELDDLGLLTGSVATVQIVGLPPQTNSYKIEILVRDFYGGELPTVSTLY